MRLAGGGDLQEQFDYYVDQAQQQLYPEQITVPNTYVYPNQPAQYVQVPAYDEKEEFARDIVDMIFDMGGGWVLLGCAAIGVYFIFKKRIKKWLLEVIKE